MKRILWGITGSGDRIEEIINTMKRIASFDNLKIYVIVSKAGEQMLRRYGLWESLESCFRKVTREVNSNVPFVAGPLQAGYYDLLVVAPLTANSTAKIAHGIADSLITNAVAQTLKGETPVLLYPVDQIAGELETVAPDGMVYKIHTREVDLRNAEIVKSMEGITTISSPESLFNGIKSLISIED